MDNTVDSKRAVDVNCHKNDVTKSTILVPILKNYKASLLEFNILLEIIGG